jgi:hypothetical protein
VTTIIGQKNALGSYRGQSNVSDGTQKWNVKLNRTTQGKMQQ